MTSIKVMRAGCILAIIFPQAFGIIPPHPLYQYESSTTSQKQQHHKQQHIQLHRQEQEQQQTDVDQNYAPSFIHPQLCIHLTTNDCMELDQQMYQQSMKTQQLIKTKGKLKVLVLLLDWASYEYDKAEATELVSPEDIENLFNAERRSPITPSGSLATFMRINSYGQFHLDATVIPWTTAAMPEDYFAAEVAGLPQSHPPYSEGRDEDRIAEAMIPLLNSLDEQGFNWTDFDQDGDGVLDSVVLLHSGYAAEFGTYNCPSRSHSQNRIWSHSRTASRDKSWTSHNSDVSLGTFTMSSAYDGACGNEVAKIGLLAHELLHTFGLPDLFDTHGPLDTVSGAVGGIGSYDVMSNPFGPAMNAAFPGSLSAWSKAKLGWVEPIDVKFSGTCVIHATAAASRVFKIAEGFPDGEYLLIENRQPILFDAGMKRSGGILVWHIDETVGEGAYRNGKTGFPGLIAAVNGTGNVPWPENGHHYRVALLQADGLYDLERAVNNGDEGDFWMEGKVLGPGIQDGSDGPVYPNTDSYRNGEIRPTGIWLENFSRSGTVMTFDVRGLAERPMPVTDEPPAIVGSDDAEDGLMQHRPNDGTDPTADVSGDGENDAPPNTTPAKSGSWGISSVTSAAIVMMLAFVVAAIVN